MVLSSKGVLVITGCLIAHTHTQYCSRKEHSMESLRVDTVSVFQLTKLLVCLSFPDKK